MLQLQDGAVFGGRYKVLKCIGSGGMGAVYLASDSRYDDFLLALKVLYPGIIKTAEARERFRTEIIASYLITHRNVVRAYEYFDEVGTQAYAMEYADNGDLHTVLEEGGLPIERVVDILRQSAAGLSAIHQRGIIHRDLKPENILLTKNNIVKIADFGVARMRGESTSLTQHGAMVGTPKYFPPEYIETGEIDYRGDIYALGVIGYELVAGCSPFRSDSNVSMMLERMKSDRKALHKIAPHCPPDLIKVIDKAMQISLADRYKTAEAMREDLECVQNSRPLIHCTQTYSQIFLKVNEVLTPNKSSTDSSSVVKLVPTRTNIQSPVIVKPKLEFSRLKMSLVLIGVAIVLALSSYYLLKTDKPNLESGLNYGYYDGYVQDLVQGEGDYKIGFMNKPGSLEVILFKAPCQLTKLDHDGKFNCKNHTYEMKVDLVNEYSAAGRLKLTSATRWARWSIVRAGKTLPNEVVKRNE